MAETQYRNRSISQLVSQLNHLGQPNVLLFPLKLTAVHQKDLPDVKRYKNSHGDQFFIPKNSEKKFPYHEIVQNITRTQIEPIRELFQRGFNVSIIFSLPREQGRFTQLLSEIAKVAENSACNATCFSDQGIFDAITGSKLTERDFEARLKYYKIQQNSMISFLDRMLRGQSKGSISLLKIKSHKSTTPSNNQINLIGFPQQIFSPSLKPNDFLGLCKSQLTQIFNYIKLNPANKYQHFSKLLTKRIPATNIIASLILEQSATFVVNWMNEGGPAVIHDRLSFYNKMRELSVLLKKEEGYPSTLSQLPQGFHMFKQEKQTKASENKTAKTDRTPVAVFEEENELDYCRSLQRKTHKYSINDIELFDQNDSPFELSSAFRIASNTPSPVTHFPQDKSTSRVQIRQFDQTMPRKTNPENLKQSQQISILKSNHAIQISQYHQTIQQLNRKILALVKDKNLQDLYSIHQRQIMLLQLKIKQLRNDISVLTNSPEDKTYKSMVRKLNDQIKRLQSKNSEQKLTNSKTITLEKQVAELRKKYEQSQNVRKRLNYQLQHLTKRLKICDSEIQLLNNKEAQLKDMKLSDQEGKNSNNMLSLSDNEALEQIQILIRSIKEGSEQSKQFLMRKITNILTDLSGSRNTILECNDFLVQLEEHLEQQLGKRQPQIVLDCNKFIRNFLMDNLNIF